MSANLMADSKQREYQRGYNDGREGKSFKDGSDAGTALITAGLAGGPRENANEYKEGFRDGREDKSRK